MGNEGKEQEKKLNDGLKGAFDEIGKMTEFMQTTMNNLLPQSPPKEITIETVIKKGFFGFGKKSIRIKTSAYISMNSILCFDFKDKDEMRKYFDSLK